MEPEGMGDLHGQQGMGKMALGIKTAREIVRYRQGKEALCRELLSRSCYREEKGEVAGDRGTEEHLTHGLTT